MPNDRTTQAPCHGKGPGGAGGGLIHQNAEWTKPGKPAVFLVTAHALERPICLGGAKRGQERIFTPTYVGGGWGAPGPQSRNFDEKKNGICPKSRWMYQKAVGNTQKAAGYTQQRAVEAHPHPLTPGGCVV